jgi:hypothetical protein
MVISAAVVGVFDGVAQQILKYFQYTVLIKPGGL